MVHVKITQLIAAAGITVVSLAAFGGIAAAAPTASTAAVSCVNGDGVMDLALSNPATDASAEFVVTNPETFVASVIDVGPGASQIVRIDGLADGSVVVPVQYNGNDASVSSMISCDATTCAAGVLSVITDQNGVQHQACVDSAAVAPPVAPAVAPVKATLLPTTSAVSPLPQTGAGTGGLVIAAILVGSGSVASLLSRRKS
jgi:LPXTG-motif cell wall-anchored protein